MERQLIVKHNVITGDVTWDNPDKLTQLEAVGLLEWAKVIITAQIIEESME
jgi:hypothetical protein